jgi:hypothetical protein
MIQLADAEQAVYSSTVSWVGTTISIGIVAMILLIFFMVIKMSTDDSEKHSEIRKYIEALFGGQSSNAKEEENEETKRQAAERLAKEIGPFEDACPACQTPVTHQNIDCPSCGLRLI